MKSLVEYEEASKPLMLQRYSTVWSEYIDVIDPKEIDDGDRLSFPKGGSPTKSKDVRMLTV